MQVAAVTIACGAQSPEASANDRRPAARCRPAIRTGNLMRMIRPFGAARRLVAVSAAMLTVGIGVVAGAPAAHASSCGWTGGWAPITLENGWVSEQGAYDTGDPSYCLETDGMVYLSGSI